MATKVKVKAKAKEAEETPEVEAPAQDSPLLDLSDAAVKKMIKSAKKRGFVTYDELNSVMPSQEVGSEQIEDVLSMLSEMGINVIETEEADEAEADDEDEKEEGTEVAERPSTAVAKTTTAKEPTDRTDDPVRMYLREMGSVELLSREGEIAIAKRIEAGRETMIAGLCESPLTFQAIIIWRDELAAGKILLRDIIDLEATYAGPDAKNAPIQVHTPPEGGHQRGNPYIKVTPPNAPPIAPAEDDDEVAAERARIAAQEEEDDDEFENAMSLAAMEAELKPAVVETFDTVAAEYKKLRRLQDQDVELKLGNKKLTPSQERRYKKLKDDIVKAVKSLSLNQHRIDSLVEQLYDINKRLVSMEGRLLRLAESHKVSRESFLKEYQGTELDPNWLRRISNLSAKGWKEFVQK
ncbi:MAG: RNA polymerase sigma factor region1.1 domain-containing protein, partial [Bauldia sp.]